MNDNDVSRDFEVDPEWVWAMIKKHGVGLRANDPFGYAYVLTTDARDLVQEILDPSAREWSAFRLRRYLRMAIDMLIDAERLASMPD